MVSDMATVQRLLSPLLLLLVLLQGLGMPRAAAAGTRTTSRSSRGDFTSSALPTPQDLVVQDLEHEYPAFASFEGRMYAGSLPMDNDGGDSNHHRRTGFLQFWLFLPDRPSVPQTMISWFNGGPGCSSFSAGNLMELGPVTVPSHPTGWCCESRDAPLVPNPYAWTHASVLLFVEQPVGVGFSKATHGTPPPASEDDVAAGT